MYTNLVRKETKDWYFQINWFWQLRKTYFIFLLILFWRMAFRCQPVQNNSDADSARSAVVVWGAAKRFGGKNEKRLSRYDRLRRLLFLRRSIVRYVYRHLYTESITSLLNVLLS